MVRKKKPAITFQVTTTRYAPTGKEPLSTDTIDALEVKRKIRESFDSLASYEAAPDADAREDFHALMVAVPDFGIGQLSLAAAATLIAAEFWLADRVAADLPDNEDFQFDDPRLVAALSSEILRIQEQLVMAVEHSELVPSLVRRSLMSSELIPSRTFVDSSTLREWLESREFKFGEFFDSYETREEEVRYSLINDLYNMRMVFASGDAMDVEERWGQFRVNRGPMLDATHGDVASRTRDQLVSIAEQALAEVARLRLELRRQGERTVDKPLSPKSRSTFLKLVASLCLQIGIKSQSRDAVGTLAAITQRAGLPIGDDTLRKVLGELPEVKREP